MRKFCLIFCLLACLYYGIEAKRRCWKRVAGTRVFPADSAAKELKSIEFKESYRTPIQNVYLWPSLTEHEKKVLQDSFYQISRRTCIRFNNLDYKPWYHADRWKPDQPYVVIRKSKQFKGCKEELLRPDALSYIQPYVDVEYRKTPKFTDEQLQWPFDPESVTIPHNARYMYELTVYCQTRKNADIGAGQRVGLLTRWDAIKLNSMYCPEKVGAADPRYGPCILSRKGKASKS